MVRHPSITPPSRTPELCKQGLDVQCMSMTVHMSSCGSKGQVRYTHLHSQPVPMAEAWVNIYQLGASGIRFAAPSASRQHAAAQI